MAHHFVQTSLDFGTYGIAREQACILCHLSSECAGCCQRCEHPDGCQSQSCSLPTRHIEGNRWDTWMHLVGYYPHIAACASRVIPASLLKKYGINKLIRKTK